MVKRVSKKTREEILMNDITSIANLRHSRVEIRFNELWAFVR